MDMTRHRVAAHVRDVRADFAGEGIYVDGYKGE
jgi:hypothetical protein